MRTGFADIICCSSSSENDYMYNVPIYSNFLWTANLLNFSTFFGGGGARQTFLLFSSVHFIDYEL